MKAILIFLSICMAVQVAVSQYDFGLEISDKDLRLRGKFDIDSGNNSVYMGMNAGINNMADGNVFIGGGAGIQSTAAFSCVLIGPGAGSMNTNGSSNVYIGTAAGTESTSGSNNVYIGESVAGSNQGWSNVVIGYQAGFPMDGSPVSYGNNVLIGNHAGRNGTGSSNIFIGNESGANATGSNQLYIENTGSNSPLIFGDFMDDEVQINGSMHITEFAKLTPLNSAPASPEKGTIYYDDTDDKVKVWTGATWENLN